jgi:hypothetical protein
MGGFLVAFLAGVAVLVGHLLSVTDQEFSPVAHVMDLPNPTILNFPAVSIPEHCRYLTKDLEGAEDFAFQGDWVYSGLRNGTILRFNAKDAVRKSVVICFHFFWFVFSSVCE